MRPTKSRLRVIVARVGEKERCISVSFCKQGLGLNGMVNGEAAEQPSYCSDQARSAAVGVKQCWKMLQECIFENLEHELE